ncbi:EscU/YscU/HrcU family type III secretion system export apparatus switch protein [Lutispora thermophila]|uniref:Flagellar biosynthesis protein n=1 Tax=Lutispora thermophila DSM 19022 TaxID=1122184 RepID=A0A1M6G5U0_9FIRM|nr:EscU/YscU/HrcU family type III secretion system export apparatus switch protein [Lutispora thermophila]SHJ05301.1 flagellar biosynthesis protein [Lutispora thermophila DSM 19022]
MSKNDNKVKKAAALSYNSEKDVAPKIVASGRGLIAENIIKAAIENKVPVFQNSDLVDSLLNFQLGSEIPPELYVVVAEVLAFISYIDKVKGDKHG